MKPFLQNWQGGDIYWTSYQIYKSIVTASFFRCTDAHQEECICVKACPLGDTMSQSDLTTICSIFQHYLPLDRLTVHEAPKVVGDKETENTSDVTDTDDVIDEDSDSASGEAKSRRKNSKFLDRKRRQQLSKVAKLTKSTTSSSSSSLPSNDDDTFENLAPEAPTTEQVN